MKKYFAAIALALIIAVPALAATPAPSSAPATPKPKATGTKAPAPAAKGTPKPAPKPAGGLTSNLTTGSFNVETDETNYNLNTGDFEMPHHVHFTRPGTDVTGDKAHGNTRSDQITIEGNVVLHQTGTINSLGAGASRVTAEQPSTLTTDSLFVDGKAKTYTAVGNVKWVQGNKILMADRGVLNENTHLLNLQGNVHIEQDQQSMDAQTVDYNLDTERGTAVGKPVLARLPIATNPPSTPGPPQKKRRKIFGMPVP